MTEHQTWQVLLDFWFGELTAGIASEPKRQQWFQPDPHFDDRCRIEFGPLLKLAAAGGLDAWRNTCHGCLAFILLTDQLPRNIYRGNAEAYAWDALALSATREGIKQGFDRDLAWDQRSFFYMPFEHSEDILDQHLAVGLFAHLRDQSPPKIRNLTGNNLRFAQQHREIILRFGRFPHRNAALGRTSSTDEEAFVAGSNGFGQSV